MEATTGSIFHWNHEKFNKTVVYHEFGILGFLLNFFLAVYIKLNFSCIQIKKIII